MDWEMLDLLDAAHVSDLPVALGALRMGVVAAHARRSHDDRRDETHVAAEEGVRSVGHQLVRIGAQRSQRVLFEGVERMGRAVLERIVRHEAVGDVVLLLAYHAAELDRKRGRDRDRAGDRLVVVRDPGVPGGSQHPAGDVRAVVAAHARDHGIQVARLTEQRRFGEPAQVEPDRERQAQHQERDEGHQHEPARSVGDGGGMGGHGTGLGGGMDARA